MPTTAPALLQAAAAAPAASAVGGYGASLLQSLLALAAVCLLAWVVLRWISARGLPGLAPLPGARGPRRLEVVERLPLDGKRALWLVRADGRTLLVGTGEGGAPALLGDWAGGAEGEVGCAEAAASGPRDDAGAAAPGATTRRA